MKQLIAFTKKEVLEQLRSGKLIILTFIFLLFGIMSPAIAKLTPWMMDVMAEELAKNGMTITEVKVDAMTSWAQFYKNMPIALIVFLVLFAGILCNEYQKGTLINIITKGLNRWKIIISKLLTVAVLWTLGFSLCYGVTYGYNSYFWDNSIASNLFFSSFCLYLLGLWLITLIPLASTLFTSTSSVILSLGGAFVAVYLLSFLPAIKEYSPFLLMDSSSLLTGASTISHYIPCIIVTVLLMGIQIVASIHLFNKKNL